ncbi:MAG: FecR domain-containing protein [Fidelibacterota bacterium]|nr:MAG: FecR domain-containing protein [Candidatus Neomarinimicrobiota bacterium]
MSEPSDWTMLARYLAGECTAPEKTQVEAWMDSDPENRLLFEQMQVVWETQEQVQEDIDVRQLWLQVAVRAGLHEESRLKRIADRLRDLLGKVTDEWWLVPSATPALRYATIGVLVVVMALLVTRWTGWFPWDSGTPQLTSIEIPQGERSQIAFSDGSTVVLDAGTILRYPQKFARDTREVFLDGEGFFEVAADSRKPFIVHASDALVQVLGTKFNVRAWEPDQRVQVAVSEGQVSLRPMSSSSAKGVIINKGEGSIMPVNGQPTEPVEVDIDEKLGWMQNEAVFRDVTLREVLFQIERWYNLKFELAVPSIAEERVTLHLRSHSVDDVLELISVLAGLPHRRDGRIVRLGPQDLSPGETEEQLIE